MISSHLQGLLKRYGHQFFSDTVYAYLDTLPSEFRDNLKNIEFLIEDVPNEDLLSKNPRLSKCTLGVYTGIPLPKKSVFMRFSLPDIIYLFRVPILNYHAKTKRCLEEIINGVLRHEIAHYYGYSDDDLHAEDLYNV